ncbi:hypothetical protein F0U61_07885 [Archangium violaceum]|uniref:hypothetical protein n=1 Tax=Archangium violaceum TaxID=83451 RepID=UPI002B2A8074|nr:hypothetical protein F0U61_07885 [Archangium violaceum]
MPDQLNTIYAFAFRGSAGRIRFENGFPHSQAKTDADASSSPSNSQKPPSERVHSVKAAQELNQIADEVSERIESELRKHFPPSVRVQAEVRFAPGSLVVEGTVLLLESLGRTALQTVSEEAGKALSELIRMGLQRVLNSFLGAPERAFVLESLTLEPTTIYSDEKEPSSTDAPASKQLFGSTPLRAAPAFWMLLLVLLFQALLIGERVADLSAGRRLNRLAQVLERTSPGKPVGPSQAPAPEGTGGSGQQGDAEMGNAPCALPTSVPTCSSAGRNG